jgi:hypothetical protein
LALRRRRRPGERWLNGRIARAPNAPDGWETGPPDVVGVGAQKSGTTWWWSQLAVHPGFVPPLGIQKELHYFGQFCERPWTDADADAYARWFPRPAGALAGEWTPRYMADPWTTPLLRRSAPDATLIMMLRDPVERYRSGLDHVRKRGATMDANTHALARQRGLYAQQLRWMLAQFPAEQVLVLQYEWCVDSPEDALKRTLEAVRLDPATHPGLVRRELNKTSRSKALDTELRDLLRRSYEDEVRALLDLTDAIDVALWPSFEHLDR